MEGMGVHSTGADCRVGHLQLRRLLLLDSQVGLSAVLLLVRVEHMKRYADGLLYAPAWQVLRGPIFFSLLFGWVRSVKKMLTGIAAGWDRRNAGHALQHVPDGVVLADIADRAGHPRPGRQRQADRRHLSRSLGFLRLVFP